MGANEHLKSCLDDLSSEGYAVGSGQCVESRHYRNILAAQQANNCELVIKQHVPENPLKRALITPEDWQLLRNCPVPVLMIKTDTPWTGGNVLAAVDVGNGDLIHRILHTGIVSISCDIAELAQAQVHVVCAHPSPMLSAADPVFQLRETIKAKYQEKCAYFQEQFSIQDHQLHIEEGPADVIIPFTARKLQAALTVIGSVGRSGLSGALVGNTAEMILDTLDCDILVLKPNDITRGVSDVVLRMANPAH